LAAGGHAMSAIAAVNPPSAATVAIVRFLIIAPPNIKRCGCPREEHAFLRSYDIARSTAIKRALFASWCFRRSVAGVQHIGSM
jgi:hypothetical protein